MSPCEQQRCHKVDAMVVAPLSGLVSYGVSPAAVHVLSFADLDLQRVASGEEL